MSIQPDIIVKKSSAQNMPVWSRAASVIID